MEMIFAYRVKKYQNKCIDDLTHISNYRSKNDYNITLDKRIIDMHNLEDEPYTALQFCSIIFEDKDKIF